MLREESGPDLVRSNQIMRLNLFDRTVGATSESHRIVCLVRQTGVPETLLVCSFSYPETAILRRCVRAAENVGARLADKELVRRYCGAFNLTRLRSSARHARYGSRFAPPGGVRSRRDGQRIVRCRRQPPLAGPPRASSGHRHGQSRRATTAHRRKNHRLQSCRCFVLP